MTAEVQPVNVEELRAAGELRAKYRGLREITHTGLFWKAVRIGDRNAPKTILATRLEDLTGQLAVWEQPQ